MLQDCDENKVSNCDMQGDEDCTTHKSSEADRESCSVNADGRWMLWSIYTGCQILIYRPGKCCDLVNNDSQHAFMRCRSVFSTLADCP